MSGDLPWDDYERGRLRPGWCYPVGRDLVEGCLRDAGALVGALRFCTPDYAARPVPEAALVVSVLWFSDAQSGYLSNRDRSVASHLFMRVWAVPSGDRRFVRELLVEGLPEACRWAAAAPARGGAWTASGHAFSLRIDQGVLRRDER